MKYYKPIRAARKIWLWLASELERGRECEYHHLAIDDLTGKLESFMEPLWTDKDPSGQLTVRHLRTREHDALAHYVHAQTRGCQAFQNMYLVTRDRSYLRKAQNLADYLLAHQEGSGLFRAHRKSGYPQDEGIMTYWAAVSLTNMSRLSGSTEYLDAAVRAGDAGRTYLFGDSHGYVHTCGQRFWTPNASAVASLAYMLLYEATSEERYCRYVGDGLKHVVGHLNEEGMVPYCERRPSIYLSSYHALVTHFLLLFRGSQWDDAFSVSDAFERTLGFLRKLTREDGSIAELDVKYESYALTIAISAAIHTEIGEYEVANELIAYLSRFFTSTGLCLFQRKRKLYYGRLRPFYDYFLASMLEWLSLVMLRRRLSQGVLERQGAGSTAVRTGAGRYPEE